MANQLHIPLIVAINKIDRPEANIENVYVDLSHHGLVPEALGGDVICEPISAKENINLDKLKDRIISLARERINLLEDYTTRAQCIVIESNVCERSGQITATVIVKKGTLKVEDMFISGLHEGKVKLLLNDLGWAVQEAYPGEAVHVRGFKHFPEVGNPLYAVNSQAEAKFIVQRIK